MRFDIFTPKAPPLFGLDIGNNAIKLVELSDAGKGAYKLERYIISPLPKDAVVDGAINNPELVSDAIKAALSKFGTSLKSVAIALPSASVFTKRISMSGALGSNDIEYQVAADAEQFFTFSVDEVNLDFNVIGPSSLHDGEVDVLIAGARKEKIEERVASVDLSKLKAIVVDAENFAVAEALKSALHPETHQDETIVYAQMEYDGVGIIVFRNGEQIYSRDQSYGNSHLTNEIVNAYGVKSEEAEAMRAPGADRPADYQQIILEPFYGMVAQEIQRALQMFITSTPHSQTDLIVVGGVLAHAEYLQELIFKQTQTRTVVANPFRSMSIAQGINKEALANDSASLMVACGLAFRRFDGEARIRSGANVAAANSKSSAKAGVSDKDVKPEKIESPFCPRMNLLPYREDGRVANRKQFIFLSGSVAALGLAIALLVHGVFSGYIAVQESRNAFIASENAKLDSQIGEIKRINSEIEALLARKHVIESLQSDRAQAIQILDQMARIAPSGLYLTSMKQTGLKVSVTGFAPSSDQVSAFMVNVQGSPYLERPELVEIKSAMIGTRRLAEFSLNFSLKRPKAGTDQESSVGLKAKPAKVLAPQGQPSGNGQAIK